MSLREEIKPYRDSITEMILAKDGGRDNLITYTCQYLDLLTPQERGLEWSWFYNVILKCELRIGLFNREPGLIGNMNAHDDLTLLSYISPIMAMNFHEEIYYYGHPNFWFFNTVNPEWSVWKNLWETFHWRDARRSWLYRIGGFTAGIKARADKRLNLIDVLYAYFSFKNNMKEPKEETSGKILCYFRAQCLYGKSKLLDKMIRTWNNKMMELYGDNYLQGLYSEYHGISHPFTKYAKTVEFK